MRYTVVSKCATEINTIGKLKNLHRQGKEPIVVFDPEAKDGMWFLIALPKKKSFHSKP